ASLRSSRTWRRRTETDPLPGISTIDDLSQALGQSAEHFLKTTLLRAGHVFVVCVLPGNRDLSEANLRAYLKAPAVSFATDEDFVAAGSVAGFAGPQGLRDAP